jgi:hypothetical protein
MLGLEREREALADGFEASEELLRTGGVVGGHGGGDKPQPAIARRLAPDRITFITRRWFDPRLIRPARSVGQASRRKISSSPARPTPAVP